MRKRSPEHVCNQCEVRDRPDCSPERGGTVQILNQRSQQFSEPLVRKVYAMVQSIFRYGCNICTKYWMELSHTQFANQLVCDDSFGSLTNNGNNMLQMISKRIEDSLKTENDSSYPQYPKRRRETGRRWSGAVATLSTDGTIRWYNGTMICGSYLGASLFLFI